MESQPTFGDNNRGNQIGLYIDSSGSIGERNRITEWLAPVNFLQKQNDVFSNHQPGTGHWFLNSTCFKDWLSGKTTILWCHGIPGSGKTVLTSIAVDHLQGLYKQDPKVGVAVVYCEYKQHALQTPTHLLASIWRQLDQWKDESHPDVQDVYNRRGRFGTKPTLDEVVSILRQEILRHSLVYILIDAFDEYADDGLSRETLFTKLQEMLAAKTPNSTRIQLLVTSRSPENMFSSGNTMQIQAAEEDVMSFVSQRFNDGISRSRLISENVRKNEELKEWIIKTVVEKADKIFLMARLHLDSLKYKTNLADLREAVQCFPRGLDELYKDTWTRVEGQDLEWRTLAKRTLGWLSSTFRQLNVKELRHALAVRSGDTSLDTERLPAMDVLCESCHGFVAIDEESQIIRLVHRTAQEFFDRHRAQYLPDIHRQITETCLDYLMLDVFAKGPCDFISSRFSDMGGAKGDISESRLLSTRITQNPFLDYAAIHWGIHARGEPELIIEKRILAFLQQSAILDSFFQVQYSRIICGGILYAGLRNLSTSGSLPLHVAVSFGLEHIVSVLLGSLSASEVNGLDRKGKTALHWAVLSGSESLALILMQAGAEIDTQVIVDHWEMYRRLGMGSNSQTLERFLTPPVLSEPIEQVVVPNEEILENAVRFDMKKVIEMHIHSAVNAAEKRGRANAILWKASSLGKPGMLDVSLENGAEIEAKEKEDILTPQIEDFRVQPVPRKPKGQTALLMAVENGRVDATLALLSRGALISATDQFGKNVLQTAVTSTNVFDERLSFIRDHEYRTKFSRVLALGPGMSSEIPTEHFMDLEDTLHGDVEQVQILEQLLDSGADIAVSTQKNQTLLHLAIASHARLELLMIRGARVLRIDSCDRDGRTALHYAAAAGNHRALRLLLARGADIGARDPTGATALHLGVLSPLSVEFALRQGISANATDKLGRTPMHYLQMLNKRSLHDGHRFRTSKREMINGYAYEEVVKLLKKAGASNLRDAKGWKPNDYLEGPLAAQFELTDTARWIGDNEERYQLQREVIHYYFNTRNRASEDEFGQSRFDTIFGRERSWRIVPDEVSASPSELD